MDINRLLKASVEAKASDIFIIAGTPISFKINGRILAQNEERLTAEDCEVFIKKIYELTENRSMEPLLTKGDDDFAFSVSKLSRFRVSVYKQRSSLAAVIRIISFALPNPKEIHIPESVIHLGDLKKGLVLITGSAGSGKTTTLSCIIDYINSTRNKHIITLEDPLEYLHPHKKSLVSQREISMDTESYVSALRSSLRQAPDVILLGEMRDYETINIAMTAAETGHLVLSTLHTVGAANAVDRIIDVFPENQQRQVRVQLGMVLKAVVSQQLIPSLHETPMPAFELMYCNSAIHNMIREAKTHQIDAAISSFGYEGMVSMNQSLRLLLENGEISEEDACLYSPDEAILKRSLNS